MSLGWMFYLADVSESLKIFFFLLAIVFFVICSFFCFELGRRSI